MKPNMFEMMTGVIICIVCGFLGINEFVSVKNFLDDAVLLNATVTGLSSGLGPPSASIVYQHSDKTPESATIPSPRVGKRGGHKWSVGTVLKIYVNEKSQEVKIASFLVLWFYPILYAAGTLLGLIFVGRAIVIARTRS